MNGDSEGPDLGRREVARAFHESSAPCRFIDRRALQPRSCTVRTGSPREPYTEKLDQLLVYTASVPVQPGVPCVRAGASRGVLYLELACRDAGNGE